MLGQLAKTCALLALLLDSWSGRVTTPRTCGRLADARLRDLLAQSASYPNLILQAGLICHACKEVDAAEEVGTLGCPAVHQVLSH